MATPQGWPPDLIFVPGESGLIQSFSKFFYKGSEDNYFGLRGCQFSALPLQHEGHRCQYVNEYMWLLPAKLSLGASRLKVYIQQSFTEPTLFSNSVFPLITGDMTHDDGELKATRDVSKHRRTASDNGTPATRCGKRNVGDTALSKTSQPQKDDAGGSSHTIYLE